MSDDEDNGQSLAELSKPVVSCQLTGAAGDTVTSRSMSEKSSSVVSAASSPAPPPLPPFPGSTSHAPPGIRQPFQPPSGTAFACGMPSLPLPGGGDLAQVETVLAENPPLTEQVTLMILQQYPLYAANPLTLRFIVYNELQQLKKLHEHHTTPASHQPKSSGCVRPTAVGGTDQPTSSGCVRPTTTGGVESSTKGDNGTAFPESGTEFARRGGSVISGGKSSRSSTVTAWNSDIGTKRPSAAAVSTNIPPHSSISAVNSSAVCNPLCIQSLVSQASARPTENSSGHFAPVAAVFAGDAATAVKQNSSTEWSGSGTDFSERGSSVPEISPVSSSAEWSCGSSLKKRPAANTMAWSAVAAAAADNDTMNPASTRPRGNASLDSFNKSSFLPLRGTVSVNIFSAQCNKKTPPLMRWCDI